MELRMCGNGGGGGGGQWSFIEPVPEDYDGVEIV
jgi:hypothetical protein